MHWIADWFSRYGVAIATALSALASIGSYGAPTNDAAPAAAAVVQSQPSQQQLIDRVSALEAEVRQLRAEAAEPGEGDV